MSKIHEKVLLHYRKSEKAEYEVRPRPPPPLLLRQILTFIAN